MGHDPFCRQHEGNPARTVETDEAVIKKTSVATIRIRMNCVLQVSNIVPQRRKDKD